ncbi:GNAT family N-acetyltransferase [Flavobacteriaceae bacterium]|nr:GNAT family N-acetyltransferase [Flavobacteriaceae bacterium]
MKAIVRKAKQVDSASILNLIKELALFEKEPESVMLTQTDIEKHGFGSHPKFECLVAEVDQKVVGMALYYPRFSTWKGPTFHLEDLIVSEQFKGNGIGTQLYSAFIQQSYGAGVERIEWNVLDWNTPAVEFYKKSGAEVLADWRTVQMHRPAMEKYLESFTQ